MRAHRRALRTIAEQPALAIDYLAPFLSRLTRQEIQRHYECYVAPYFTADGEVDLGIAQHAVEAVATELGVAPVAAKEIYQTALRQLPSKDAAAGLVHDKPLPLGGSVTILPMILLRNAGRGNAQRLGHFYPVAGLFGIDTPSPTTPR